MLSLDEKIHAFLAAKAFAVAGASDNPEKYGHKCYAALLRHGRTVYPLHPLAKPVLGNPAFAKIADLPQAIEALSIVTAPSVTEKIIEDAITAGVKHIWMQPGAESPAAIASAERAGLNVIAGGPCLLVLLAQERA